MYDGVPPEKVNEMTFILACLTLMASCISLPILVLQARSIMHFAANPIDLPEYGVSASARMTSRPMSSKGKRFLQKDLICFFQLIDR